ncbi:TSCPD domain-containing protein [Pseudonocardia adelaidensis]|uniref:ribonucleoside-diphosphate reductase n=1 Tax=Pseudonocardia adelaidensis TaxID=648754 RepID=A0ABP9NKG8_9PSEU
MALPARTSDTAPSARQRLPRSRQGTTTSFEVAGTKFFVIANADEAGALGEVFAKFGKEGSTTAGLMELLSIAISLGLQHGVPLETFVAKFRGQRFEPMGMTDDPDIPIATSVGDYLARRLAHDWLDAGSRKELDLLTPAEEAELPVDAYAPTPLRRPVRA